MSDSHRSVGKVLEVVERHPEADLFLHLGDGEADFEAVQEIHPEHRYHHVSGNCDYDSTTPTYDILCLCKKIIFLTHGHRYAVKYGLEELKRAARRQGADVVLYGHTHMAHTEYDDGLYVMNPGSLTLPRERGSSYGILDITPAGIVLGIVDL